MAARLHAVNRLPPTADTAVAWVIAQAGIARLTVVELREGLNERLAPLGIAPISHSAFARWFSAAKAEGFPKRNPTQLTTSAALCCPSCGAAITVSVAVRSPDQPQQ
jgi:hypothetical protein